MSRNYSFNTIWAGWMLDPLDEEPPPYFLSPEAAKPGQQVHVLTNPRESYAAIQGRVNARNDLHPLLEHAQHVLPEWAGAAGRPYYRALLRSFLADGTSPRAPSDLDKLGTASYRIQSYEKWESTRHERGLTTARDIEKSLRLPPGTENIPSGFEAISAPRIQKEFF
jgi:hypothetical protein